MLHLSVSVQTMTKYESWKDKLNETIRQSSTKTPRRLRKLTTAPSPLFHIHYTHAATSGLQREDDRPRHSPPSLGPEGSRPCTSTFFFFKSDFLFSPFFFKSISTTQRQRAAQRAVWACLRNEAIMLWWKCQASFECLWIWKKGSEAL